MNRRDYWSPETNPETGEKFARVLEYFHTAHNGSADIDSMIDSPYGEECARRMQLRFKYEHDAMGEAAMEYYRACGLKKEMYDGDDYYARWVILTPLEMETEEGRKKKYPIVFYNHGGGNSIECEEFSLGFAELAGRDKFMVAYLQNTNWENFERVLDFIGEKYPLDRERVYLCGYSQGGYQVTSTYFRIPQKLTAVGPCGNDIYREYDNFNVPYTPEEIQNLKDALVPLMQVVGVCEASSFVPVNDWKPRKDWGRECSGETYLDDRRDDSKDPTRIHGGRRRFSDMPVPPEGEDKHEWMIRRLNMRMDTLNCEPRDAGTCISYLNTPEDELHHVLGFYGDKEEIAWHYGYKYYTLNIWNRDNLNAFRYVAVENNPHWPPVLMAELLWDFFRQFRRDSGTGRIVEEEYCYNRD